MTIKAHYDGKVFVPDEAVDLPQNHKVVVSARRARSARKRRFLTAGDLAKSSLVGIWADRKDITDSLEFARELRRRAERREI